MRRLLLWAALGIGSGMTMSCENAPADMAPPDLLPGPLLAPCLDRPDELPRPPAGALPCELIPPSP